MIRSLNDEKVLQKGTLSKLEALSSKKLVEDKEYKIHLICNYSRDCEEQAFTNFLNNNNKTAENLIVSLYQIDGSFLALENFLNSCNSCNNGFLKINDNNRERFKKIFALYSIELTKENEDVIYKAWRQDVASGLKVKEDGNLFRYYYILDENDEEIRVILLDVNHLVATDKYKEEYKKYKNYHKDIKKVINEYIKLFK